MTIELNLPVVQPAREEYDRVHMDRALDDLYRMIVQLRDAISELSESDQAAVLRWGPEGP